MALKYTYNSDGSIKSVVSDNVGTDAPMALPDYMYGNNQSPTQSARAVMSALLGNQMTDPITGQLGKRTFNDFKNLIKLNKRNFLRDKGKFNDDRGGGLKSFNKYIDQLQRGEVDTLSSEEAKYIDDLKNNKINL